MDYEPGHSPLQETLAKQLGSDYSQIPNQFTHSQLPPHLKEMTHPDNLCRLPVYTNEIRHFVLSQISAAIRDGSDFAIIKCDSDQLKSANEQISREFGDETIKYSASQITGKLSQMTFNTPPLIFRSTTGGDELYLFILNATPAELTQAENLVKDLNSTSRSVTIPSLKTDHNFTMSTSAGITSSQDRFFQTYLKQTQTAIQEGKISHGFNLIQEMIDKTEDRTSAIKVLHELDSLPISDLLGMSPIQLRLFISKNFGGRRISEAGLNILFMIDQIVASKYSTTFPDSDSPPPEIESQALLDSNPKSSVTLRKIVDTWNSIFKSNPAS